MARRSRRAGSGSRRTSAIVPRIAVETSSLPRASAPGDSAAPAERMPTNAEPHAATVTSPATRAAMSAGTATGEAAVWSRTGILSL
jgi:hypothetical protein